MAAYLELVASAVVSGREDGVNRVDREELELPVQKVAEAAPADDLGVAV